MNIIGKLPPGKEMACIFVKRYTLFGLLNWWYNYIYDRVNVKSNGIFFVKIQAHTYTESGSASIIELKINKFVSFLLNIIFQIEELCYKCGKKEYIPWERDFIK